PDDDFLFGGPGADTLSGGTGFDAVSYGGAATPVTVTLDGNPNDGTSGEHDNVNPSVEEMIGGSAGDRPNGDRQASPLIGEGGDDVLVGGGGNDVLWPGAGNDTLSGGPGVDTVSFADSIAPVSVSLAAGTADGDGPDSIAGVERLRGSPWDDHLI